MKCLKSFFNKKSQIAEISMKGVIGSKKGQVSYEAYSDLIEKAFEMKNLSAVILTINSPGGSPTQSELIYKKIKLLKEKNKDVKVIANIEDFSASGAYYISCAADLIMSSENSIVGSIGVISAGFGFAEAIKKVGIERRVYTQGTAKNILDPFLPEKKEDIALLKEMQEVVYNNFRNVVKGSRGDKLSLEDGELFSGKIWVGIKAKDIGLVDEICTIDEYLYREYDDKFNLNKIEPKKKGLLSKFGLSDFSLNSILDNLYW